MGLIVQKYGGTSVRDLDRIRAVARRALETQAAGNQVAVVVSAMAGETNRLLDLARDLCDRPAPRELDVLVATGEQVSIALLCIAIEAAGGRARSFLADQIAIRTDNVHGRARILSVEAGPMRMALQRGEIAVVAGFQGVDVDGNITTLGRGGSDTTAVALAAAVGATACEIYTDVEGIYTTDPSICPEARKVDRIAYEEMLELASLGAKVLQVRSVEFAMNHKVPIHVRSSYVATTGSWVVPEDKSMEKVRVRGITCDRDAAKITVKRVPDRPGIAADIFRPLAEREINVDVILQNAGEDGHADLTFTVARSDLGEAHGVVAEVARAMGAESVDRDPHVAKVSVVGVGMRSHAGVASRTFTTLAENGINIEMISTSEIKISCVIAEEDTDEAVRVLHAAFDLGAPAETGAVRAGDAE